jgi:hypothetical protein
MWRPGVFSRVATSASVIAPFSTVVHSSSVRGSFSIVPFFS